VNEETGNGGNPVLSCPENFVIITHFA
jgi:hypothetical protein